MTTKKTDQKRSYPPEFCSGATLAYRLDCSESTLDQYVSRGLLPKPLYIGSLKRWRWQDVEAWLGHISVLPAGQAVGVQHDPYSEGLDNVSA